VGEHYYDQLAAAFVRGRLGSAVAADDVATLIARGRAAGLKLHKFKRTAELPRVRKVLGLLRAMAPQSLLDVGSGRGTFLWPLVDAFPSLAITAIDVDARRAADLHAVRKGGVARLSALRMDGRRLAFSNGAFDVVTLLEVLEHMPSPELAAAEALRVARRFVIASVPSKPDDNPEHIHLFDRRALEQLFAAAGRVTCEWVLNHAVVVARV
jgi:ubiquinone/menaquinone biosynthesis C-methylase UbiE